MKTKITMILFKETTSEKWRIFELEVGGVSIYGLRVNEIVK